MKKVSWQGSWFLTVILLIGIISSAAHAQEGPIPGEETVLLQLGYFFPAFDTKLRVADEDGGRGSDVNLQNDLGFERNETTILAGASWRITPRHRVAVGYFGFHRTADRTIDREIEIGDETYPVGAELHSTLDISVIPIAYSYSFIKNDTLEFTGSAGLQWSSLSFKANGSASSGTRDIDAEVQSEAQAPLPLIGLGVTYYFAPKWSVGGNFGTFIYKVAAGNMNYQGFVLSATTNIDWWFSDYIGAGAAVNWFGFNVNVEAPRWNGSFNYQYLGPQVYLTARF
jgi:hypothetical protein